MMMMILINQYKEKKSNLTWHTTKGNFNKKMNGKEKFVLKLECAIHIHTILNYQMEYEWLGV